MLPTTFLGEPKTTTKIITFLIGNPYKPSFTTATVRGPHPRYNLHMTPAIFGIVFWGNLGKYMVN